MVVNGKVLSGRDLTERLKQLSMVFPFNKNDVFFNTLLSPWGIIYGTLLPILNGAKVFLYSTAENYRAVPEWCYDCGATVILGNNHLFENYAVAAHPYDFFAVKYAIAAGDKLSEQTYHLWLRKFGIRILEGYWDDNNAALLAMNSPIYNREGSLGCLLPGIDEGLASMAGLKVDEEGFVDLK